MAEFDYDAIFNKSRHFIARAIRHRNFGEYDEFQLWAAFSLELLGKAALAFIHPSLIADPNSPESMFAACGRPYSTNHRTIMAKTVFERLRHVSRTFDRTDKDFCISMSQRRNAELHSGAAPLAEMPLDTWLPRYWLTCKRVLQMQQKEMEDWVGTDEAADADRIISEAISVIEQVVQTRIANHRQRFRERFRDDDSRQRFIEDTVSRNIVSHDWFSPRLVFEAVDEHACPSCTCIGAIAGEEWETVETGEHEPEEPWLQWVDTHYGTLAFKCQACDLALQSAQEVVAAGIREVFTKTDLKPVEAGEEYMNE